MPLLKITVELHLLVLDAFHYGANLLFGEFEILLFELFSIEVNQVVISVDADDSEQITGVNQTILLQPYLEFINNPLLFFEFDDIFAVEHGEISAQIVIGENIYFIIW